MKLVLYINSIMYIHGKKREYMKVKGMNMDSISGDIGFLGALIRIWFSFKRLFIAVMAKDLSIMIASIGADSQLAYVVVDVN
ncbi:hypothetical protein L2E82_11926 [Cichorium intybus]|uniref:Uncharacterized protein n=1 Tax=Cichorium intybus TaxID=13427 RepID=A0ACB9GEJ1_CICIN|nr:hypothetical protein L2E82_11926 [Cichorium intybus]